MTYSLSATGKRCTWTKSDKLTSHPWSIVESHGFGVSHDQTVICTVVPAQCLPVTVCQVEIRCRQKQEASLGAVPMIFDVTISSWSTPIVFIWRSGNTRVSFDDALAEEDDVSEDRACVEDSVLAFLVEVLLEFSLLIPSVDIPEDDAAGDEDDEGKDWDSDVGKGCKDEVTTDSRSLLMDSTEKVSLL